MTLHALVRLACLMLLAALAVPSASAAIAHLPLAPGDAVDATDGPADRELDIQSLFGTSVLVIETSEPAVVAVRVSHSDDTATTHILQTTGGDSDSLHAAIADLADGLAAQQASMAALHEAVANLTGTIGQTATAVAQQRATLQGLLIELNATMATLDDVAPQLDQIQATANEANLAIQNFRIPEPDYSPITSDMDVHAKELEERLGRLHVLLVFTLMAAAGALLHAGWQAMDGKRPDLSRLRDLVRKPKGGHEPEPVISEDARAASEELTAELLPEPSSEDMGCQDVPSGGDSQPPDTTHAEPESEDEGSAPAAIPLQDERLARALHIEGGLPLEHGSQ